MPRGKPTITRDSVFRAGGPAPASPARQGIKPPEATTHQTGVWLSDEEVDWLDSRCREIRRGGWRGVTRSAVIRALIRAAMAKGVELEGASGEEDLTQRLGGTP